MASSGSLRRVALVITDVSEELSASFIRVTRIGELGTTLIVTSNSREKLKSYIFSSYLEFRTMDNVHKPSSSQCCTLLPGPVKFP
jgi:hypothetical protein